MGSKDTTTVVLGALCAALLVVFVSPAMAWMIWGYWRKRKSILISKRHPLIALVTMGFSLCSTLLVYPLWVLRAAGVCGPCAKISNPVYCLVNFGTALSLLLRFFIIYYELHLAHHVSSGDEEWQRIIDPRVDHVNWFVQQMTKWGSSWWLSRRVAVPWLLLSSVSFALWSLHYYKKSMVDAHVPALVDTALLALIFVIQLYFWRQLPQYQDSFKVKQEYSLILLTYGLMLLFVVVWAVLLVARKGEWFFWADLALGLSDGAGRLGVTYCMTWWVMEKDAVFLQKVRSHSQFSHGDEATMCNPLSMQKVLSHNRSLCEFMRHLCSEFSEECLLSYIEITQLLAAIRSERRSSVDSAPPEQRFVFPKVVPLSQIVANTLLGLQDRIHVMWEKFIAEGARLEVNIPGELRVCMRGLIAQPGSDASRVAAFNFGFGSFSASQRRDLDALQSAHNIWKNPHSIDIDTLDRVVDAFAEVQRIMWGLMESSFARFALTDAYAGMVNHQVEYFDFTD